MTRQEFYEKYGEVIVEFAMYYKFTFSYTAKLPDGSSILVRVGGNSDDIYRMEVCTGDKIKIKDLMPYAGSVFKENVEIEEFYDY